MPAKAVQQVSSTYAMRTNETSKPKKSANPAQTPAIILSSSERLSFLLVSIVYIISSL